MQYCIQNLFELLQEAVLYDKYFASLNEALINRGFKWIDNLFDQLYGQYKNWNYEDILFEKDRFLKSFEKRGVTLKIGDASDFDNISGYFDGEKIYLKVPNDFLKICLDEDLNSSVKDTVKELIAHEDIHLQSKEGFKYEKKSPKFNILGTTKEERRKQIKQIKRYVSTKQEINAYARQAVFQLEKNGISADEFLKLKTDNKLEELSFKLKEKGDDIMASYFYAHKNGMLSTQYFSRFLKRVYYFLSTDKVD